MMDLIEPNSMVIEFGCGNGDLLFKLSSKIEFGLGIDNSKALIDYVLKQKRHVDVSNVDFLCEELGSHYNHSENYDFSISSLFFHVIPERDSIYLLNKMRQISNHIMICGFSCPETAHEKLLLWLDQRFSGHYRNFIAYQKNGYFEGMLEKIQYSNVVKYDTSFPFIKIYKIN